MTTHRRTTFAAVTASAGALALLLTGCTGTQTDGSPASIFTGGGCAPHGTSASAATATVRCFLDSIAAGNTQTACSLLTEQARREIVTQSRDAEYSDTNSAYTPGGSASTGCATVSMVMDSALDQLSGTQLDRFRAALRAADVGPGRVAGDRARVRVTASSQGNTSTEDAELVRTAGTWRIDSDDAFGSS